MADFVKTLKRQKYDEAFVYYKRINGKWVAVHYFGFIHKPTNSKKPWCFYNKQKFGETTKTKVLEWLRKKTT